MIEKIHRYSGLLMTVLVISAVAFIFGDFNRGSHGGYGSGRAMMKIDGVTYTDKEFDSLGKTSLELASSLAQYGDFECYQFLAAMAGNSMSMGKDQSFERFFTARMILRQAKDEFGIYPGDNEITEYLRGLRVFAGPEGKFSPEAFRNFIQLSMGRFGMSEKDLRGLVSDILAFKKLREVVGGGFAADRDAVAKNLALQKQEISGEIGKLDLTPYEEKIQPTEEEIKKYWESISDSFTTEPRRKFTYIIASPGEVPDAEADKADEAPSIADAAATDEAKKEAAKKKEEEKAKRAAELADARRKKQTEIDGAVDDFMFELQERKGAGFEERAKENGWEVKTTELFTQGAPPKELDLSIRASSRGGKLVEDLFKIQETADPLSKISEAIAVGENQWAVARLDVDEKSRTKTYEEARNDARAQYISEKATEALKTAATEAITKIKAAMGTGKSFADAAKEAGISEVKEFSKFTSTSRSDTATQPQNLFELCRNLDPGSIAEPVMESDRAFILHVAKREVVKDANAAASIDAEVNQFSTQVEYRAFDSWLNARIDAAKVEALYK